MNAVVKTALWYTVFACAAIACNITAQDIAIRFYTGIYGIPLSVLTGTAVGLVVKYVLDKHFIFRFHTTSLAQNGRVFLLYTATGILTTMLFWGMEWAFHLAFETKFMRYTGGVLGLIAGYICKYFLDKKFVFSRN